MTTAGALAGLLGLGLLAAAVGTSARAPDASAAAMGWGAYQALCEHWASVWGLPALILEVVGILESGRRSDMSNDTGPDRARGGSWGLFGLTLETAADLLRKHPPLRTQPAARAFDGTGESLHNVQLSAMLASFLLATLWHRYSGNTLATIAAYQQGPGPVDEIIARHGDLGTELPPRGQRYLHRARVVIDELSPAGAV